MSLKIQAKSGHAQKMILKQSFFEFFADHCEDKDIKTITMLSERGMCDSCKGVMEQFKQEYPNIKVNVISNKKVEGDVWKKR